MEKSWIVHEKAMLKPFITDLVKGAQQNALPGYLITRVGQVTDTTRTAVVQK